MLRFLRGVIFGYSEIPESALRADSVASDEYGISVIEHDVDRDDSESITSGKQEGYVRRQQKYFAVVGAFVINLVIGGYVSLGAFLPYLASYLTASHFGFTARECSPEVQAVYAANTKAVNWMITTFTLGYAGFGCIGGILQLYWGTRYVVLCGGAVVSFQFVAAYYGAANLSVLLICSFGIAYGIGCGIIWSPSVACLIRWFPQQKGLMTGIIMSALAVGSMCFSLIGTLYINPGNQPNDELCGYSLRTPMMERLPNSFILLAMSSALVTLVGVLCLSDRPDDLEEEDEHEHEQEKGEAKQELAPINTKERASYGSPNPESAATRCKLRDYTVSEAIRSSAFWIIFGNVFCLVQFLVFTYSDWKFFAESYLGIEDDAFLLQVNIAAALSSLSGRFVWGSIYDRTSYRKTMLLNTSIALSTILTLPLCVNRMMTLLWVCLLWFSSSAVYTTFPPAIANAFGDSYCGILTGIMMLAEILSTVIQSALFTITQSVNASEERKWIMICCVNGGFVLFALCLATRFVSPKR